MTDFIPRPFRLQVEDYDVEDLGEQDCDAEVMATEVVGWGMTLPNGSAIAVDNSSGHQPAIAICSGAARAAFIFGADLVWLADPPTPETPLAEPQS